MLAFIRKYFGFNKKQQARVSPATLVCISDLHSLPLPNLPDGDILIVAGDLCEGRPQQLLTRLAEFTSLSTRFQRIVIVGGNHDRALCESCDERDAVAHDDKDERVACRNAFRSTPGITYLENSGTTITLRSGRRLHVWGSPGSLAISRQTAFGYRKEDAADLWKSVPEGVDLLVTHGPPKGYLDGDRMLGCIELTKTLWRVRPQVHVFGHVHQDHGRVTIMYDNIQRNYDEAIQKSLVTMEMRPSKYVPPHIRNKRHGRPVMPEQMLLVPDRPPLKGEASVLVNAALVDGDGTRQPIVVQI